jgi:hypothetical protein
MVRSLCIRSVSGYKFKPTDPVHCSARTLDTNLDSVVGLDETMLWIGPVTYLVPLEVMVAV